jgi:hypothetical protein
LIERLPFAYKSRQHDCCWRDPDVSMLAANRFGGASGHSAAS